MTVCHRALFRISPKAIQPITVENTVEQNQTPWQLRMFQKTLKKQMRYEVLKGHLGSIGKDEKCLLLTRGDNNGAMNYYLRELGGEWSWADLEGFCIAEMSELLGDDAKHADKATSPFRTRPSIA